MVNSPLKAQYKLGVNSFGMILNNDSSKPSGIIASGFAIDTNIVISCYHIFKNLKHIRKFYQVAKDGIAPVRLVDSLPEYDIAILKSPDYLTNMPMTLGDYASIKKGDRIGYVGFNKYGEGVLCVGFISKTDSIKSNGIWVNRLIFSTRELPGFPGSPILNTKGKVIGMITKGSSLKRGSQVIGIVGYSVKQLKYTKYQGF